MKIIGQMSAIVFLLVVLVSLPRYSAAVEPVALESSSVDVVYPRGLKDQAMVIVRVCRGYLDDLKNQLGWGLSYKPRVFLVADEEFFQKISGTRFAVGLAIPGRRSIAINIVPMLSRTYLIKEVFRHELCHLVLHDHIKEKLLPRWLDEGTAQWASGNLGELLIYEGQFRSVKLSTSRVIIPLDYLDVGFPSDPGSLFLAYEESLSFVNYVVKKFGKKKFVLILHQLERGKTVKEAFPIILSRPLWEVEKEWVRSIRNENRWLIWISRYLYQLLFVLGAILAAIAFVKVKLRKRKMDYGQLEDDDFGEV